MILLPKGESVQITGSVSANGFLWWCENGKETFCAAEIQPHKTLTIGPYLDDCQFLVIMETGAYFAERLGVAPVTNVSPPERYPNENCSSRN